MDKTLNVQRDRRGQDHLLGPTGTGYFDMTAYVPPTMNCRSALIPLILCSISPRIRISERRHRQVLGTLLPSNMLLCDARANRYNIRPGIHIRLLSPPSLCV